MANVPSGIVTHARRVCSLYKRSLRALRDYNGPLEYRYEAVLMRDRFDKNAKIKDLRLAKDLLIDGEKELFQKQDCLPIKFAASPGGVAYEREVVLPDWMLDYWDPMEKAFYPKYFARREERKKQYLEWFYKTYPNEKRQEDHHSH